MEAMVKSINKFKLFILKTRLKEFNKPGEGGIVATLLETKHGEPVLLALHEDKEGPVLNFWLYSVHWTKIDRSSMILFLNEHSLQISDIQVLEYRDKPYIKKYGKGYGTIFMTYLIKEAKKRNLTAITGEMSFENDEQKVRQKNFYTKYGFHIDSDYKLLKML
ncbi:hypothetical protein AUC31_06805 [Planococcus rifietoensis]|uniref:N-acetyltransferase domain-containing protein n=1 Tax=Planococcus rifietoensis TaxID=200991 RepID=A0A0U2N4M3_9BACL|nr:GNAT family N-acetyltransferase [Planococcus rifietoensis]ALS74953.1 hypothetical protein AUC31_06805 [Planococcus rifietoensis]